MVLTKLSKNPLIAVLALGAMLSMFAGVGEGAWASMSTMEYSTDFLGNSLPTEFIKFTPETGSVVPVDGRGEYFVSILARETIAARRSVSVLSRHTVTTLFDRFRTTRIL